MKVLEEAYERARALDQENPCFKDRFFYPTLKSLGVGDKEDRECTYLCGNSLGLMPRASRTAVEREMDAWARLAVTGHYTRTDGSHGWATSEDPIIPMLAKVLGCKESETAITGSLTMNLNALLACFYRPSGDRYRLFFEEKPFPSDNYCFQNQVQLHGYTIDDGLIRAAPRESERTLRTEDIIHTIQKRGKEIAVVIFSGVQFYTGQYFDIPKITAAAHEQGCIVGWDLAHAVGNVELKLHDWDVDFAVFCSYKYLNAGPGSTAGFFVHERFHTGEYRPRHAGWFGVGIDTRFDMKDDFEPVKGARGWVQSCLIWAGPPTVEESLKLFEEAGGMGPLRKRSQGLTTLLADLLQKMPFYGDGVEIITPLDLNQHGAQLSLLFHGGTMPKILAYLEKYGVICDERKPDVIRVAPAPLYNTYSDVVHFVDVLQQAFKTL